MIITNKFNLPKPLVDAVSFDAHRTHGQISVTGLIDSPQIFYLKKKHGHEVAQDVSGMIFSLFGTAIHAILERANIKSVRRAAFMESINALREVVARNENGALNPDETPEEADQAQRVLKWLLNYMFKHFPELEDRYMFEVSLQYDCNGWTVSGTLDLYDKLEKCLYDYKATGVWNYVFEDTRKKWAAQLNCYALFLKKQGIEVELIKVVAIFRDWSRRKAMTEAGYPKRNVLTIDIPLYDETTMEKYVLSRVKLHQKALSEGPDPCTGKEQWATARMFAVLQKGGLRAITGTKTEAREVAEKYIRDHQHSYKKELYIRETPAEYRRCQEYCIVSEFCEQWRKIKPQETETFTKA